MRPTLDIKFIRVDDANKILLENQNTLAGLHMNMSLQVSLNKRALADLQQAREKQGKSIADAH